MRICIFLICFLLSNQLNSFGQECVPDSTVRKEVLNTKDSPYKYIMLLSVERQRKRTFQGTGFLIAPRVILTAAHNIHHFSLFSSPKKIRITPGANYSNKTNEPFGSFKYDRKKLKILTHPSFKGNSTRKSDFGVIILPNDSIYNRLGGF